MKRAFSLLPITFLATVAATCAQRGLADDDRFNAGVEAGASAPVNALEACFTDAYEPNDSCGEAAAPLVPGFYTPLYVCAGEDDWYAIEVPAGYRVEVNSYFTHSGSSDLELRLFDSDCSTLLDSSSTVSDDEMVSYQATTGGTLFVRSFGWDNADEGSHELEVKLSCDHCFTYQGTLQDAGSPATGDYEFLFTLYDAVADGVDIEGPITRTVSVEDGIFTTQLYFGEPAVYSTQFPLFLQIDVRPAGSGDGFTSLAPRQELTAVPFAQSLIPGASISGALPFGSAVSIGNPASGGIGLQVSDTGSDGIQISEVGGYGVSVTNPSFSGVYVSGAGSDGFYVSSPGDDGVQVFNPADEGVYVSGAGGSGVYVSSADQHGVYGRTVSSDYLAGYFINAASSGEGNAVYASGNSSAAADLALGGSTGRITALGSSTADMYLDSNDSVIARVDRDGTSGSAYFGVINSDNSFPFYVYESGNAYFAGSVSKGGGSFMIDHPLDPANKLLYHSFVESPDMMNIYNGNVELDANGSAWVELPEWFGALNRDYRYQLTPIGAPGPNLYVAQPVENNRFRIAGGEAGMTVSWQVTGIRQDAFAEANRIPVEVEKPAEQRGTYLHPEAFGQPTELKFSSLALEGDGPEPEEDAVEGADEAFEPPEAEGN
jgi:hypothetical protein